MRAVRRALQDKSTLVPAVDDAREGACDVTQPSPTLVDDPTGARGTR